MSKLSPLSTGSSKVTDFLRSQARDLRSGPELVSRKLGFTFRPPLFDLQAERKGRVPGMGHTQMLHRSSKGSPESARGPLWSCRSQEREENRPDKPSGLGGGRCRAPRWVADAVFRLAGPFSPFETRVLGGELRYLAPNGSIGLCPAAPNRSNFSRLG